MVQGVCFIKIASGYLVVINLPPKTANGSRTAVKITWYQVGIYGQDMTAFITPTIKRRMPTIKGAREFSPAISAANAPEMSEIIEPMTICVRSIVLSALNWPPSVMAVWKAA